MKVYISTNYNTFNPVRQALDSISDKLNIEIIQTDYFNIEEQIIPSIVEIIKNSDVVIADISNESPNIYYEVGIAHSKNKPVILVSQTNNFNRFSLLANRFYQYDIDSQGIKNLSFRLQQLLSDANELRLLRPLSKDKQSFDFEGFTSDTRLDEIISIPGVARFYAFEKWIYNLLREIPGFEVEYNEQRNGKEYDFIVWNSNNEKELSGLGNPIPIEVKATSNLENVILHSLVNKAGSQGFKSCILFTTATLTDRNRKAIRDIKVHASIVVLIIDGDALKDIASSKDLVIALIKSYRKFFIY